MFECETKYVSIFKINDKTQAVETVQILQLLETNIVISVENSENGIVGLYVFEDAEGKNLIENMEVSY